jgi:hypothetical protein
LSKLLELASHPSLLRCPLLTDLPLLWIHTVDASERRRGED